MSKVRTPSHLVLVSVDSLRFDAFGVENDTRWLTLHGKDLPAKRHTPALDRLARQGVHFNCVLTSAPYTTNAHAGLFTGQWPWVHGVRSFSTRESVPTAVPLLAEVLKSHGFATLSASGMPHLFHSPAPGFQRGMDECLSLETHLLNRHFNDVLSWMGRRRAGRFFVFYHTTTVHDYLTERQWRRYARAGVKDPADFYRCLRAPRQEAGPRRMAAYLEAVNFFDRHELSPLLDFLKAEGLEKSTLLVVVGDHGEPHGLREEEVRVPLPVVGADGLPRGRKIADPVRLMDVFPTVLELLGIGAPSGLPSASLSPFWRRRAGSGRGKEARREAYMEYFASLPPGNVSSGREPAPAGRNAAVCRGLRLRDRKLIRDYARDAWSGYDLRRDWRERRPQPSPRAPAWRPLRARLEEIERLDPAPVRPEAGDGLSDEVVARLRRLGYLD